MLNRLLLAGKTGIGPGPDHGVDPWSVMWSKVDTKQGLEGGGGGEVGGAW